MADTETTGDTGQSSAGLFEIKDCALIALATGRRATTLKELRDNLAVIDVDSLYFHFWGSLLQPRFEEREYNNDFAAWARHSLHNPVLAEQLAVIDPTDYDELEELREELLQIVDEQLDEREYLSWERASERFEFIRSQIVVFDTGQRITSPGELPQVMPHLSAGSVFYHFIDARRRLPERIDDFRYWLVRFGADYDALRDRLAGIDPYFGALTGLREQLSAAIRAHLAGAR